MIISSNEFKMHLSIYCHSVYPYTDSPKKDNFWNDWTRRLSTEGLRASSQFASHIDDRERSPMRNSVSYQGEYPYEYQYVNSCVNGVSYKIE